MSTCWRLSNEESGLPRDEFLARLAEYGIHVARDTEEGDFQISDGDGFVWCHTGEHDGKVSQFETNADSNNPSQGIFEAIGEITGENVLSEHDDGFFDDDLDGEDGEGTADSLH